MRNYLGEKCRKYATWDKRLYLLSERRRAEDFFRPQKSDSLTGFERANLGAKGQHATCRPPKPLIVILTVIGNLTIHTERVVAFPLQQWPRERAMLRHTYFILFL